MRRSRKRPMKPKLRRRSPTERRRERSAGSSERAVTERSDSLEQITHHVRYDSWPGGHFDRSILQRARLDDDVAWVGHLLCSKTGVACGGHSRSSFELAACKRDRWHWSGVNFVEY